MWSRCVIHVDPIPTSASSSLVLKTVGPLEVEFVFGVLSVSS